MTNFRLLVCGGRTFSGRAALYRALDILHGRTPISQLIHGGARGADTIAGDWALSRKVPIRLFPAQWHIYGRSAGYIRNQQMLDEGQPSLVLACPGGPGTVNMVSLTRRAHIPITFLHDFLDTYEDPEVLDYLNNHGQ